MAEPGTFYTQRWYCTVQFPPPPRLSRHLTTLKKPHQGRQLLFAKVKSAICSSSPRISEQSLQPHLCSPYDCIGVNGKVLASGSPWIHSSNFDSIKRSIWEVQAVEDIICLSVFSQTDFLSSTVVKADSPQRGKNLKWKKDFMVWITVCSGVLWSIVPTISLGDWSFFCALLFHWGWLTRPSPDAQPCLPHVMSHWVVARCTVSSTQLPDQAEPQCCARIAAQPFVWMPIYENPGCKGTVYAGLQM